MSFIKASEQITELKEDMEKFRYIQLFLQNVKNIVNGGLNLAKNMKFTIVEVSFSTANLNTVVAHGLGRKPIGYIVVKKTGNMNIYDSTAPNIPSTENNITLKSSAVGTASIVFI